MVHSTYHTEAKCTAVTTAPTIVRSEALSIQFEAASNAVANLKLECVEEYWILDDDRDVGRA
eukprot:scaffold54506_cov18-Prasinocladus_malaysianus.AAC.1